jgi:paraquat-inducible protein A
MGVGHPIVCPDCDLLLEPVEVSPGHKLVCPRCNCTLRAPVANSVEKTLALSLTGLIMFFPGIFLPLLSLDIIGLESSGSIFSSATALVETGYVFTGVAVFLTSILIPAIKLLILFLVSLQVLAGRSDRSTVFMFRAYKLLDEWGMLEVYMIGILVTIIKLLHMAKIQYDAGFYCFIGLLSATILSSIFMDEHQFWEKIHRQVTAGRQAEAEIGSKAGAGQEVAG